MGAERREKKERRIDWQGPRGAVSFNAAPELTYASTRRGGSFRPLVLDLGVCLVDLSVHNGLAQVAMLVDGRTPR